MDEIERVKAADRSLDTFDVFYWLGYSGQSWEERFHTLQERHRDLQDRVVEFAFRAAALKAREASNG